MHGVKLRVHIAPLGFEYERIVLPVIQMKADKVWLISKKYDDKAQPYKDKIIARLKKHKIDYDFEECEIIDLYDVLKIMRIIVEKERGNDVFINVSSGSKIEAIAGMMASMIFRKDTRIVPYYVVPDKYLVEPKNAEPQTKGVKGIQILPDYRIEQPKESLIELLKIIDQNKGAISKKELIDIATKQSLITVGGRNPTQSKYMSLNKNYLEQLQTWKLIDIQKVGRKKNIVLTEEGKNMLRFLA